jgi:diguanylate cyclase (GGDEF)-like protein
MLVGDIGFAVLAELGAFTNNNVINITWLLAYVLFGAAALHPSMAKLSERAMEPPRRFTRKRLSLLTSVSLVAPVLLLAQTWWHGGIDTAAIGIGAIVLFLLVVARMSGLIRQVEEQAARLETLAQHDPLTGAANRRAWDHNLPVEMDRARRTGTPLALALLDLDHFKRFNDEFGHDAGDVALREAATVLVESVRTSDVVSRVGGEEFLLILPGASIEAALQKIDRMRVKVKALELFQHGRRLPPITFSAGAAAYPANGTAPDVLLRAADKALYEAKHAGRDRSVLAIV